MLAPHETQKGANMTHSLRVALPLFAAALALVGVAPAFAAKMTTGRIHIEYVPPKTADLQALFARLKERGALEKTQAIFTPFRLPRDVTIQTIECGESNAWYQPVDGRPTVTLCYEYLQEIWTKLPTTETDDGVTPTDALVGQALFATAHEFGHLAFDVYRVPLLSHEEDAADNFATYLMLRFRPDGPRLIKGAAWSYHGFIKDYRLNPKATLPLAAFSSDHGQPEERFYNMMCIAYGSDATLYAGLVAKGYLPQSRARNCKYEYAVLQFGFNREILPHIDTKKGDKVLATDWLATSPPPSPLR
jgi:hypothetical protein